MILRGLSFLILSLSSMCVFSQTLPSCDHISSGRCLYKGNVYVGTSDKVKTKDFYEGELLNRLFHGKGSYWFYEDGPNKGDKYVGEFVAGGMTGNGTYYFNSGEKYVGGFKKGVREGLGTNYFVDGTVFEGNFVAGHKHKGTQTYSNGDKYVGSFANNQPNGFGTFYKVADSKNKGDRYQGNFKDGLYSGKGTYYLANGDRYEGIFANNLPNGHGIYYMLANDEFKGSRYEGKFLNGEYSGVGAYYYPSGAKLVCEYLISKCNGVGVYVSENNIKYVGEYLNDLRHGHGVLYNASGGVISQGLWAEGKFISSQAVSSIVLQKANQVFASATTTKAEVPKKQLPTNSDSLTQKCKNLGLTEGAKDFELCLRSLKK